MAVLLQIALISAISLICGDMLLVLGTLEISFEDVGSFEYTGEKAYMEGDRVELNCDVYDAQQLLQNRVLVYTKDGIKLTSNQDLLVPNGDNHYLIQHNILLDNRAQYNLFINGVTKEDQGDYQCSVHVGDPEGAIVEAARWTQMVPGGNRTTPKITVLYLPDVNRYPECVVDEGTVDVKLGSTLTLKCNSEFGNPPVLLEWKRNNGVDPDPRNQIGVSSTMSTSDEEMTYITKVTISAEYSGVVFYCYMTPSLTYFPGDLRSCQVGPINIIDSDATLPTITPLVQVAEPGDTVNFECDLADDSQAEFQWSSDPRWTFEKQPVSPDTRIFTFRNVRSYHHLTKIFCKTFSQGVQVSAYGLIRVNADQYEEPPSLPPDGDGDDSTGGQQGGGQNGGQNPGRTEAPILDTTRTTKTSAASGVRNQSKTASARFGQLLVIVVISFLVTLF